MNVQGIDDDAEGGESGPIPVFPSRGMVSQDHAVQPSSPSSELQSRERQGEGRVALRQQKAPIFRMKADGRHVTVTSASAHTSGAAPPSPLRDEEFSAKRRDLDVAVRQLRSRQSAARVSDILSRIAQMKEGMESSLSERSLAVQAHDRVIRKLDVVIHLLEALAQDARKGRDLPLVLRDRHDAMLHKTLLEALAVLCDSASEGGSLLHSFRNAVVDTREWLHHLEDELDRISQGTVVLAMADASELQPLFEALYSQWCWRHGTVGRFFRAWRVQVDGMLLVRDKVAMEKIVKKLQTLSMGSVAHAFAAWVKFVNKKIRNVQLKARMVLTNMFSDKVWAFRKWRTYFLQSVRSRHILDKIEFRMQILSMQHWAQCTKFKKYRAQKRRFADDVAFKKICQKHFHAWSAEVSRQRRLAIKVQSARALRGYKLVASCLGRWLTRNKVMIYRRRELQKSRRSWLSMHFRDWRDAARDMRRRMIQVGRLQRRVEIRAAEEAIQNWCDAIELNILRRLKAEKYQRRSRILTLLTIFRQWVLLARITQDGVTTYRIQRMFAKWQRQVHVAKTVKTILGRWTALLNRGSVERCFRRYKLWYECQCDALDILANVAEQTGLVEMDTAFFRWRRKEVSHRIKRFRLQALTRRRHLGSLNFFFCFWIRKSLHKGKLVSSHHRQAVRMGLRRRDLNLCRRSLRLMRVACVQQRGLRHRIDAVWTKTRRRRMEMVLQGWDVLMTRKEVVRRMKHRLARRSAITWIRLFSRIAHEQRVRLMYGHYCPECRRPLSPSRLARARKALAEPTTPAAPSEHAPSCASRPASAVSRSAEKNARPHISHRLVDAGDRREYRRPSETLTSSVRSRPSGPKRASQLTWRDVADDLSLDLSHELEDDTPFNEFAAHDALQDQVSNALALAYEELEGFSTTRRSPGRDGGDGRRVDVSVADVHTKSSGVHRANTHVTVNEARDRWYRELRAKHQSAADTSTVRPPTRPRSDAWEELKGGLGIGIRHSLPSPQLSAGLHSSPLAQSRTRPRSACAPKSAPSTPTTSNRPTSAHSRGRNHARG